MGGRPGRRRAGEEEEEEGAREAPLGAAIFRRGTPPRSLLKRQRSALRGGSAAAAAGGQAPVREREGPWLRPRFLSVITTVSGADGRGADRTGACGGRRLGPPLLTGLLALGLLIVYNH